MQEPYCRGCAGRAQLAPETLVKLAGATATSALGGFTAKLRSIAEPMRQTLTYDQGKEMARQQS